MGSEPLARFPIGSSFNLYCLSILVIISLIRTGSGVAIDHCKLATIDSTNITRCLKCQTGYWLSYHMNYCWKIDVEHCVYWFQIQYNFSVCIWCQEGYQIIYTHKCVKLQACVDPNCYICDQVSLNICLQCFQGYQINNTYQNDSFAAKCIKCRYEGQVAVKNICTCPNGTILDSYWDGTFFCRDCRKPCKQCSNYVDNCISCIPGYWLKGSKCIKCSGANGICNASGIEVSCEQGFVYSIDRCIPHPQLSQTFMAENYFFCKEGCYACIKYDLCLSCLEGYTYNQQFYECFPCSQGCRVCDFYDNLMCITCAAQYRLQNGQCFKCQVANCLQCYFGIQNCFSCLRGYTLIKNQCRPCAANCLKCDKEGEGMCDEFQCNDGFARINGNVCGPCALECYFCMPQDIRTCIRCPVGTFQVAVDQCEVCQTNCIICFDAVTCDYCKPGYRLVKKDCFVDCIFPCIQCSVYNNKICFKCSTGYRLSESYACVPYLQCNDTYTCEYCPSNYYQKIGYHQCFEYTHVKNCLRCLDHYDRCEKCMDGFYLFNNECLPCNQNCTICYQYANSYCFGCVQTHYLQFYHDYELYGECLPCDSNCLTCQRSSTRCKTCQKSQKLIGYICVNVKSIIFSLIMQHAIIKDDYTEKMTLLKDIVNFTSYLVSVFGGPFLIDPGLLYLKGVGSGSVRITFLAAIQDKNFKESQKAIIQGLKKIEKYKQFTILQTQIVESTTKSDVVIQMADYYKYVALIPAPIFSILTLLMIGKCIFRKLKTGKREETDQAKASKISKTNSILEGEQKGIDLNLEPMMTEKNLRGEEEEEGAVTL